MHTPSFLHDKVHELREAQRAERRPGLGHPLLRERGHFRGGEQDWLQVSESAASHLGERRRHKLFGSWSSDLSSVLWDLTRF